MTIAFRPLRNPNPLGFPGGVLPGVDWSHPAVNGILFSGIARGTNFINLMNGAVGAVGGSAATANMDALGAFNVNFAGGNNNINFTFPSTALNPETAAAIFILTSSSANTGIVLTNSAANTSLAFQVAASNASISAIIGGVSRATFSSPPVGVPLFMAMSGQGSTILNSVLARLDTGAIQSATTGTSTAPTVGDGKLYIGNRGVATRQLFGGVCAAMFANELLTIPQLLAWAADPWAFWYPRRDTVLVGAAAAAFKAYWAQQNNLPVIGAGTY